jgi:hypothetical protein
MTSTKAARAFGHAFTLRCASMVDYQRVGNRIGHLK